MFMWSLGALEKRDTISVSSFLGCRYLGASVHATSSNANSLIVCATGNLDDTRVIFRMDLGCYIVAILRTFSSP